MKKFTINEFRAAYPDDDACIDKLFKVRYNNLVCPKCESDNRILIFNEAEGYLIVLTERTGYNLFWTAYYIEHTHQKRKYIKEYEAYIKAKTA